MKALLLPVLCAACTLPLIAQDPVIDWIRTADTYAKTGTSLAVDAQDNAYVTSHGGDIWLRKYDPSGTELWEVHDSTTIQFNHLKPVRVHIDPAGDPVVVGYRYTLSSDGHNANALIVLKYNAGGVLQYELIIPGTFSYFNNSDYRTKVSSQMDAAGNVYIGTAGQVTGYPDAGFNVVKVTPAGGIAWVSTKDFGGGFHYVNNIRLKNDRLGLAGTTVYWNANASTWVLDTTGTDLWSSVNLGIGGKDFAFDDNANAYVVTSADYFPSDVALYQFDAGGAAGWAMTYDLGDSDLASRIEYTPDGHLAIMAYGDSTGSLYSDWLTLKVNLSGILQWSQRYDEHINNDERAEMMLVDANSDIYLTGIAGPYPGGMNLGARQMATVKYTASGALAWATEIDTLTEYNTGVGLALDSQGGLYVLGDAHSILIHYLDIITNAPEEPSTPGVQVYPNPASTDLAIDLAAWQGPVEVLIHDAAGRELRKRMGSAPDRLWIDVSDLPAGSYLLTVLDPSGRKAVAGWSKF